MGESQKTSKVHLLQSVLCSVFWSPEALPGWSECGGGSGLGEAAKVKGTVAGVCLPGGPAMGMPAPGSRCSCSPGRRAAHTAAARLQPVGFPI